MSPNPHAQAGVREDGQKPHPAWGSRARTPGPGTEPRSRRRGARGRGADCRASLLLPQASHGVSLGPPGPLPRDTQGEWLRELLLPGAPSAHTAIPSVSRGPGQRDFSVGGAGGEAIWKTQGGRFWGWCSEGKGPVSYWRDMGVKGPPGTGLWAEAVPLTQLPRTSEPPGLCPGRRERVWDPQFPQNPVSVRWGLRQPAGKD